MNSGTILLAIGGWIVGFLSSVMGTHLLERRRTIRAFISAVEIEMARIDRAANFESLHAASIDNISPSYFAALPFLRHEDQIKARQQWHEYRTYPIAAHEEPSLTQDIMKKIGQGKVTRDQSLMSALDRLSDIFTRRWL